MKIQKCKGTRDLSPEEMSKFRLIERVFSDRCLKWGYHEVKTPTIEYLHLFTSAGTLTPGMLGKVYSFLDWDGWSGERVVLRPDGTIPVARYYIDNIAAGDLAKLFYVTNIFIFDETGQKTRERWQGGAELIGAGSPLADTELISLSLEILRNLGVGDIELRLSHAGLIKTLLVGLGLSPEEQTRMFDQILDGNEAVLAEVKIKQPELKDILLSLLNHKGQSSGFLKNLKALAARTLPEIRVHLDDFINTVSLLEGLDCSYQIDIASGAGFEYYTGMIFQLFSGNEKIGGGGRYDDLVPAMGGGNVPASGFALYLDRLMNLIKPEVPEKGMVGTILVRGSWEDPKEVKRALDIADNLRNAGYVAQLELGKTALKNSRWILDMPGKATSYILCDRVENRRFEVRSADDIGKIVEAAGVDKDSSA